MSLRNKDINPIATENFWTYIPYLQTFTAKTGHAIFTRAKHPHSLVKKEVPFRQPLSKSRYFMELTPKRILPRTLQS